MALGAMRALADAGVRVPGDMAVVGFDDIETSRYLSPPLTTMRVDTFELGARAVERLLAIAAGIAQRLPLERAHHVLPATLVIRGSCGTDLAGDRRRSSARREQDQRHGR